MNQPEFPPTPPTHNHPAAHGADSTYTDLAPRAPLSHSAFTSLWAALRFVFRDACLEGESPRVRRQVEGLSDYELAVLRSACRILVLMAIDEEVQRA